jgi:hypothetical protein
MTDGNDVTIVNNPFKLNSKICVGKEEGNINNNKWINKKLTEFYKYKSNKLEINSHSNIIYNAGILGGKREEVLNFLMNMEKLLLGLKINQQNKNLNMIIFNYVVYNIYNENVISGFPLHSKFKSYENNRKDVYFIHK